MAKPIVLNPRRRPQTNGAWKPSYAKALVGLVPGAILRQGGRGNGAWDPSYAKALMGMALEAILRQGGRGKGA